MRQVLVCAECGTLRKMVSAIDSRTPQLLAYDGYEHELVVSALMAFVEL